jgi:hypothetical protein
LFLPVEHSQGLGIHLSFFFCFSDLSFQLLLGIERVKLRVNLLLKHTLLNLAAFVN